MKPPRVAPASEELLALVGAELDRPPSPAASALADEILRRHGDTCCAVLFYGSGLRSGKTEDVILDLLVVVDSYRAAYGKLWQALTNAALAPNVFYLETPCDGTVVRAKYAVVSRAHLARATSTRTLQVYYWGRFSQPCLLVHARDAQAREDLRRILAQAVGTFVERSIPLVPAEFGAEDLWQTGLRACYRTELRSERDSNTGRLVESHGERCVRATRAVLGVPCGAATGSVRVEAGTEPPTFRSELTEGARRRSRMGWALRRVEGKGLHFLRLIKGAFTFDGGADYLLWKIERHSGVRVEASPRARRHPLLFGWGTLWQLYRRGGFR